MSVCLIIDGGYFASIQAICGSIDLTKLKNEIQKKYGKIERAYYFTSLDGPNQACFHKWLKSFNGGKMEVVVKPFKYKTCESCGNTAIVEKGMDVGMSTLAIKLAHRNIYDTLVLMNGDGDLIDALKYIKDDFNKGLVIIGELETISSDTQCIANDIYVVSDNMEKIRKTEIIKE